MNKEKGSVFHELGYKVRNAETAVAVLAVFFGHLGVAALSAIAAIVTHAGLKKIEQPGSKA